MLRSLGVGLPFGILSKRSSTSRSKSTATLCFQRSVEPMVMQALAQIVDQVKVDVLSKTMAADNAARRRHVSRSFICELCDGAFGEHHVFMPANLSGYYHRFDQISLALKWFS
jgi:hypothetical protein